MLQKMNKNCPFAGPLFVGPVFGRTCLNPPPPAASQHCVTPTRVTNNASCNWVNLMQVSSVQFGAVNTA